MRLAYPAAVALAALAAGPGCRREPLAAPPATAPSVVNVRVTAIELSTASPAIRAVGLLARQTEADFSFPVAGVVERVNVRPGDRVTRGQELARLQLDTVDAQLRQAQSALEKARRDVARIEKLQAERVATLENLQDGRTQVEQAEAALRMADFNRRHAIIVAPSDGVVLRRLAEPNELIAAGRAVVSFASEGEGWIVRTGLAARDVSRIEVGSTAEITDSPTPGTRGKVARIAEAADPATRTVPVEVALEAVPAGARSGVIVALLLSPRPVAARPAVPVAALRDGQGGKAALFVVDAAGRVARRVSVDVEVVDGTRVFLRTALPSDARVVVTGSQYLQDGTAVNVVP